jgi:Flp pilus assembly pilin Flp
MRGTAAYLYRLWKEHSGATPAEVAIMIAFAGVILARIVAKAAG